MRKITPLKLAEMYARFCDVELDDVLYGVRDTIFYRQTFCAITALKYVGTNRLTEYEKVELTSMSVQVFQYSAARGLALMSGLSENIRGHARRKKAEAIAAQANEFVEYTRKDIFLKGK